MEVEKDGIMSGPKSSSTIVVDAEKQDISDHPLFGCLKGTVTIPEGVDLTAPAYPEWADLIDEFLDETMRQCRSKPQ